MPGWLAHRAAEKEKRDSHKVSGRGAIDTVEKAPVVSKVALAGREFDWIDMAGNRVKRMCR